MTIYLKKFLFILFIVVSLFSLFYLWGNFNQVKIAKAGSEHNLSGWAWSETIGWISFNNTTGGGSVNYGVNIDPSTGNFSGYAWSENIGWIQFDPPGPYPAKPYHSAKLDIATNEVTGWARALAYDGGWDGWIRMDGVSRSGCDLIGYAWGSDVIGWIKFKGTAQDGSSYGIVSTFCVSRVNQPPSATNLQVSQPDYCYSGPAGIFSWTFTDPDSASDTQSAYQVQVDNNSDFSSPEDNSGKVISSSNSYATPQGRLSYNTTYYWRVRVWDRDDLVSDWASGPSFTAPKHAYPSIDFSWTPQEPSVKEVVQFTDQSIVYGGSRKVAWLWTFQNGSPAGSNQQNATTTFLSAGPKQVTLKVTDSDGFACQGSKTINAQFPLPEYKEVPPFPY